jgi:hypothetical protein
LVPPSVPVASGAAVIAGKLMAFSAIKGWWFTRRSTEQNERVLTNSFVALTFDPPEAGSP